MRKSIQILGVVSSAMVIIGAVFKMMHWPGAGISLAMGSTLIILGYLPLAVGNLVKQAGTTALKVRFTMGGLALAVIGATALFKVMHWPGADVLLILASAVTIFGYMPALIVSREHKFVWDSMFTHRFVLVVSAVAIYTLANTQGPSKKYMESHNGDSPQAMQLSYRMP